MLYWLPPGKTQWQTVENWDQNAFLIVMPTGKYDVLWRGILEQTADGAVYHFATATYSSVSCADTQRIENLPTEYGQMLTLVAIYATHAVMNLGEYALRLGERQDGVALVAGWEAGRFSGRLWRYHRTCAETRAYTRRPPIVEWMAVRHGSLLRTAHLWSAR